MTPTEREAVEQERELIKRAYLGVSVLRTMLQKEGMRLGVQAADDLMADMASLMPELPGLSALRAESHPSAIREAVEGEREACAKLVAAYGIAGMPFDVGSWTPGAVAAAIRARGEEKGK